MRRSQSAVEATADYLGTRVARLSHLNPGEGNRNFFIYRVPKRWTIKVIHTLDREATTLCMCLCVCECCFVRLCGGGHIWIKGGFQGKTASWNVSDGSISAIDSQWKGQVLAGCSGTGPVRWATVGCWLCCFDDLGSAALGGENTD